MDGIPVEILRIVHALLVGATTIEALTRLGNRFNNLCGTFGQLLRFFLVPLHNLSLSVKLPFMTRKTRERAYFRILDDLERRLRDRLQKRHCASRLAEKFQCSLECI